MRTKESIRLFLLTTVGIATAIVGCMVTESGSNSDELPSALAQGANTNASSEVLHDAEHYILKVQNGERWVAEDRELDEKLASLRQKHGRTPNIVYILWDDQQFGTVGFPALQKNLGYETPHLNRMAREGINFTRMYTEPSCTPTRAAFLTGRHPVRHSMGVVGMPHEFSGLRAEEVIPFSVCIRRSPRQPPIDSTTRDSFPRVGP